MGEPYPDDGEYAAFSELGIDDTLCLPPQIRVASLHIHQYHSLTGRGYQPARDTPQH